MRYKYGRGERQTIKLPTVRELAINYYKKFHSKLKDQTNLLIHQMSSTTIPNNITCHLKRDWPCDLLDPELFDSGSIKKKK